MRAQMLMVPLALLSTLAVAQEQPQYQWAGPLSLQMREAENCVVTFIGEVTERPSPYLVRAKVACEDMRVFTVEQHGGPEQPFRVIACSREGPSC